jgi:hypothetical protein
MRHIHGMILSVALLAAGTMTVIAQERPAASGFGMPMMQGIGQAGTMPMMGMMTMMNMADHVDGRIAFLKAELKITDMQLEPWNNFADALRANARRMTEARATMMQAGITGNVPHAPDRLERVEKMMAGMLESVRSTRAALGPLYAVLSDEQKRTADALLTGPMGMMGAI